MTDVPEMVERVARAICASVDGQDPDALIHVIPDGPQDYPLWGCYEPEARAAIEAIRDNPSQDMILAGYNALMDWDARTGEDHGIFEVWQAMIAAAIRQS